MPTSKSAAKKLSDERRSHQGRNRTLHLLHAVRRCALPKHEERREALRVRPTFS